MHMLHHFVYNQDELMMFLLDINKKGYHIEAVENTNDAEYKYHVKYYR